MIESECARRDKAFPTRRIACSRTASDRVSHEMRSCRCHTNRQSVPGPHWSTVYHVRARRRTIQRLPRVIRKTAGISIAVTFALLLGVATYGATGGGKAELLRGLSQSSRGQIAARAAQAVRQSRQEASQLVLDLALYSWVGSRKGRTPDVRNLDLIIPALAKELRDQTVTWAVRYYSPDTDDQGETSLPPRDDERVQKLFDLKTQVRSALDYGRSSPLQAAGALQDAVVLCQAMHLDLGEALVLKQLGDHYLYDMARYTLAEACYERPAWTFPAYRCWASAAAVYDDFAYLNAETGRYAIASDYYVESGRNWEHLANQEPDGYRYRNLAGREYVKAGIAATDYAKALELMRDKGITQLQKWAIATRSYDVLVEALMEVAAFCRKAGDPTTSLDLLKQAQKACELQPDPMLTASVMDDLAKTYAMLKQPNYESAAVAKRLQALKSAAATGATALNRLEKTATFRDTEKALLTSAERGARACELLDNYIRAADDWRRTASTYKRAGSVDGQIRCLRALGAVLDIRQDPRGALEARREAVLLARGSNQSALAASIVQEMIQSFIALDDLDNALEGFTELTPIIEEAGNVRGAAEVLEARGSLLAKHGHPEEAVRDLDNARGRYLSKVGDIWSAARVALDLSRVQEEAGRKDEARSVLESAIQELESNYGYESFGAGAKSTRVDVIRGLYSRLIRGYVHGGNAELATELVRRGRRHAWLPKVVVDMRSDASDQVVADWAKATDVMVMDGPGPTDQSTGEKLIARDWATFAESCFWLERQHPREYNALPIDPLELLRRRERLPEGLSVVVYMPVESAVYMFVCGRENAICRQVPSRAETLDVPVSRLRRILKTCEESLAAGIPVPPLVTWQETAYLDIREPLTALYNQLLAPIQSNLSRSRRLVFVLPNSLAGLPMHALIVSEHTSGPRFLVQDYEIAYLARGMVDDITSPDSRAVDPSADMLAIFADPEDNLPGARAESAVIGSAYLLNRSYVGRQAATATAFLNECTQASLLHLAAHHRVDPNPSGFQLLLAPSAGSDGTVGIQELSAVASPYLQLVVLSACDSIASSDPISLGPVRAAEMFSLIGAKSVVGGLWKVSDEAASEVMGAFYRGLSRGKSRAEALQSAQRSMIESTQQAPTGAESDAKPQRKYAHPFYWACFALYGNPK